MDAFVILSFNISKNLFSIRIVFIRNSSTSKEEHTIKLVKFALSDSPIISVQDRDSPTSSLLDPLCVVLHNIGPLSIKLRIANLGSSKWLGKKPYHWPCINLRSFLHILENMKEDENPIWHLIKLL